MKKLIYLLIAIATHYTAFSQSLRGVINDNLSHPIPFANVLLLNSKDSTLVKGTVTDTLGLYRIDHVAPGQYVLSASMVGYVQVYKPGIEIQQENLVVPTMTLQEDARQLGEVVIIEKRPFVEQHLDRMVVNVANSIIASGSTALEVLEKSPGVTVDRQNQALQLSGKSGVIIQIDGKQTYLSMADVVTLLSTMSSDNIDQIELVTNPSAKYDAAGNSGIINIRLKKDNSLGTNGFVSVGIGSGEYPRRRGSFQLNHRSKKINVFGNYSVNSGGNYFDLRSNRTIDQGDQHNVIDMSTYIVFDDFGQNAKAGVDYFVGKNTTFGVVWTGFWIDNGEDGTAESIFRHDPSDDPYHEAYTDKTISTVSSNHVANFNVQHVFKEKGGKLSGDYDFGYFHRDYVNTLETEMISTEDPDQPLMGLLNQMPTTIEIRTAKVDYNRPLGKWSMEAGLKSSYVKSDNKLTLYQGEMGDLQLDPSLSNHFVYTEKVNAAYASFSGKLSEQTTLQAGLRVEHTRSSGNSISSNYEVERDYLNLFPSVFLSRKLSKQHTLTVSYSYRIDRPNYQNLNPARSYIDPYGFSTGNAYLNPQYTHSFELKHGFKDKLFTSVGASYVQDLVFYVIQPVDSIRTERTPLNIGTSQAYNLTMSFPVTVMRGWSLQTSFTGMYSRFDYNFQGTPITVEQVSGKFNASNMFVIGKKFTGELTGWLNTPAVDALYHLSWRGAMDIGLQMKVTPALNAKLSVQDVFHSFYFKSYADLPDFKIHGKLAFDTRIVMLNVNYSFGNQKLKGRQHRVGSEEETRRIN